MAEYKAADNERRLLRWLFLIGKAFTGILTHEEEKELDDLRCLSFSWNNLDNKKLDNDKFSFDMPEELEPDADIFYKKEKCFGWPYLPQLNIKEDLVRRIVSTHNANISKFSSESILKIALSEVETSTGNQVDNVEPQEPLETMEAFHKRWWADRWLIFKKKSGFIR